MSPFVRRLFLEIMPKILMMRRAKYTLPDYDDSTPSNGYTNEIEMSVSDFPGEFKEGGDSFDNIGVNLSHGSVEAENVIPKQLSPEVLSAIQAVRFIAQHIKDADKDNEVHVHQNLPLGGALGEWAYREWAIKRLIKVEAVEDIACVQMVHRMQLEDADDCWSHLRYGVINKPSLLHSSLCISLC
uniref:Neurotransmitter-gated ion-channel transmembrane domain-containing protein n=1 Tax=Anopheles culicifacies TaxID=139723 RepID=A0A182MIC6_9DIPT